MEWWQSGAWKPPVAFGPAPARDDSLETYFNPKCQHDRTSYDIAMCQFCVLHTQAVKELRRGARASTEVTPLPKPEQ